MADPIATVIPVLQDTTELLAESSAKMVDLLDKLLTAQKTSDQGADSRSDEEAERGTTFFGELKDFVAKTMPQQLPTGIFSMQKKMIKGFYMAVKSKFFLKVLVGLKNIAASAGSGLMKLIGFLLMLAIFDPNGSFLKSIINLFLKLAIMVVKMLASMLPSLLKIIVNLIPMLLGFLIQIVMTIVDVIIKMLPMFINAIIKIILVLAQEIPKFIGMLIIGIMKAMPVIINSLMKLIGVFLVMLLTEIPKILVMIINQIPALLTLFLTAFIRELPKVLTALVDGLETLISGLIEALPDIAITLIEAIVQLVPILLESLGDMVLMLAEQFPDLIEALVEILPVLIEAIVKILPMLIIAIIEMIPILMDAIIEAMPTIVTALLEAIPLIVIGIMKALPKLLKAVGNMYLKIWFELIPKLFTSVRDAIMNFDWDAMMVSLEEAFDEMMPKLIIILGELWEGFKEGMASAWSELKYFFLDTLPDLIGTTATVIGAIILLLLFAIFAPITFTVLGIIALIVGLWFLLKFIGKWVMDLGPMIMETFAELWDDFIDGIWEPLKAFIKNIPGIFKKILKKVLSFFTKVVKGYFSFLGKIFNALLSPFRYIFKLINKLSGGRIGTIIKAVVKGVTDLINKLRNINLSGIARIVSRQWKKVKSFFNFIGAYFKAIFSLRGAAKLARGKSLKGLVAMELLKKVKESKRSRVTTQLQGTGVTLTRIGTGNLNNADSITALRAIQRVLESPNSIAVKASRSGLKIDEIKKPIESKIIEPQVIQKASYAPTFERQPTLTGGAMGGLTPA